jgi:hypothetical protein
MNRFKLAIDVQDACNMRGIARSFVEVVDDAMAELKDTSKVWTDPAVVLFVNKLESLSHSWQNFSAAYTACQEKVK